METKNEKPLPADYEWLIKDGEQIVNWDLDPLSRDLCEYVDMASVYGNGEEDAFGHDGCGQWTIQFKYRYWTGKFRMPFTKEEYYNNDDIIATVKGLGLDTEKFWFVLVFIYDYVESSFDETAEILQPASLQKEESILQYSLQAIRFQLEAKLESSVLIKQAKANYRNYAPYWNPNFVLLPILDVVYPHWK